MAMHEGCSTFNADNIVLTAVNDGNGDQCGLRYDQRCRLARGLSALAPRHGEEERTTREYRATRWLQCAAVCARHLARRHGVGPFSERDVLEAALALSIYYTQHVKEGAGQ